MSLGAHLSTGANTLPALIPSLPQKVTVGGSSNQSAAFANTCTIIRIFPTVDCYIDIGIDPSADTNSVFCPGGIIQYFGINRDTSASIKLAVIQDSTSGIMHIVEGF